MRIANNTVKSTLDGESEVDITPMLDVVFIMLIFFIVTASFVRESGVGIHKPLSAEKAESKQSILVKLSDNGTVTIDGKNIQYRSIQAVITGKMIDDPDAVVALKVQRKASTQSLVKVVDELKSADVFLPPISLYDI